MSRQLCPHMQDARKKVKGTIKCSVANGQVKVRKGCCRNGSCHVKRASSPR